ncbi:purine permease [Trifolium repens]|nr:purine permease [Trifolium repens]
METVQDLLQQTTTTEEVKEHPQQQRDYKWWIRVSLYIVFLMVGQSAANLLGRLYYEKGGDNLMYSYGLLYLSLSTYSLLCATQLAFNAVFSYFLNSQKFTAFIFNSVVLLTMSASLLAVNSDSEDSTDLPRHKQILGFLCTLGASATFSLYLSLVQLSFDKVIKSETFAATLNMQFYPAFVATCVCVVGLFASGEWKGLNKEMKGYEMGKVSYIMTLFWTAVSWQISSIGMIGLVLNVSSLFSNVIGTVVMPVVPILAVIFFHDKINGVKFIALMLAIWGFLSYIYQHYLDDKKGKANKTHHPEVSRGEVEQIHLLN